MTLSNFARTLSALWTPERKARAAPDAPAPDALFRQAVEAWVEFKRLHLGFAQTLNALIDGNSSLVQLVRFAMLCEHEAAGLGPESRLAGASAEIAALLKGLPVAPYVELYTRVNALAFDDAALARLVEASDLRLALAVVQAARERPARADAAFTRLAEATGHAGAERAGRYSAEIARVHQSLVDAYVSRLRAKGLV